MANRKQIKESITVELLNKCRRRCCLCYGLERDNRQKNGQVAHINHDPSDNSMKNLAFLCLEHHNQYDSSTRQSRNISPAELKNYKAELEAYIEREWNRPLISENITVDIFSGDYQFSNANNEADLKIRYIGSNLLQITGLSLHGTQNEYGPNLGQLDCIAELSGNKAVFKEEFHNGEYWMQITFLGSRLQVEDSDMVGYFGAGVSFSGTYYKEE